MDTDSCVVKALGGGRGWKNQVEVGNGGGGKWGTSVIVSSLKINFLKINFLKNGSTIWHLPVAASCCETPPLTGSVSPFIK